MSPSPAQEAGRALYRGAFSTGNTTGSWFYNPFDMSFKNIANTGHVPAPSPTPSVVFCRLIGAICAQCVACFFAGCTCNPHTRNKPNLGLCGPNHNPVNHNSEGTFLWSNLPSSFSFSTPMNGLTVCQDPGTWMPNAQHRMLHETHGLSVDTKICAAASSMLVYASSIATDFLGAMFVVGRKWGWASF